MIFFILPHRDREKRDKPRSKILSIALLPAICPPSIRERPPNQTFWAHYVKKGTFVGCAEWEVRAGVPGMRGFDIRVRLINSQRGKNRIHFPAIFPSFLPKSSKRSILLIRGYGVQTERNTFFTCPFSNSFQPIFPQSKSSLDDLCPLEVFL